MEPKVKFLSLSSQSQEQASIRNQFIHPNHLCTISLNSTLNIIVFCALVVLGQSLQSKAWRLIDTSWKDGIGTSGCFENIWYVLFSNAEFVCDSVSMQNDEFEIIDKQNI